MAENRTLPSGAYVNGEGQYVVAHLREASQAQQETPESEQAQPELEPADADPGVSE